MRRAWLFRQWWEAHTLQLSSLSAARTLNTRTRLASPATSAVRADARDVIPIYLERERERERYYTLSSPEADSGDSGTSPACPRGPDHVAPAPQHVTARDTPPPKRRLRACSARPPPPPLRPRPAALPALLPREGAGGSGGLDTSAGAAARPHPRR